MEKNIYFVIKIKTLRYIAHDFFFRQWVFKPVHFLFFHIGNK
ncbi:hypothetical protein [Arsenophonus endosymbiont of Bemisia tabaci]|nr:hypothetical protein [Arsenophonus endosymbiont of Bemisia tabaci]